jgi:hypothetical protein
MVDVEKCQRHGSPLLSCNMYNTQSRIDVPWWFDISGKKCTWRCNLQVFAISSVDVSNVSVNHFCIIYESYWLNLCRLGRLGILT